MVCYCCKHVRRQSVLGVSLLYTCGISLKRQPNGLFLPACVIKIQDSLLNFSNEMSCGQYRILKNKNQRQESVKCVIVEGMLSV